MRTLLIALALSAMALPPARAGGKGEAPVNFLLFDVGARPAAMGGAYVALSDDADGLHYNPAGLAFLDKHEAAFMHAEHFTGSAQEYASVALKGPLAAARGFLGEGSGIGLAVNTFGFGSIQRTTLSNTRGAGLDSFGARDWAVSAGYARRLPWDWVSAGLAVKWIREELDDVEANSGAVDMGARADLKKQFSIPVSLGVALQNMGAELKYQSESEPLPLNLRFGASYKLMEGALLALDLSQPSRGDMSVHAGAEYVVAKALALRVGYDGRNGTDSGIAGGAGVLVRNFGIDYAFVPFGSLGDSHRLGLRYRW